MRGAAALTLLGRVGRYRPGRTPEADVDRGAATPYGSIGEPIGGPRFAAMAAAGFQTTLDGITRFSLASLGRLGGDHVLAARVEAP